MASTMSSTYIPEDVMLIVLSWLPVKSLLRFESVCKLWLSIISEPEFIEIHRANSSKQQQAYAPSAALLVENDQEEDRKFYLVHSSKDIVRLPLPPQLSPMIRFVNTCNGLVCLANHTRNIVCLWNPSTKWYKMLLSPKKNLICFSRWTGFGFDSICNDYKLLRIMVYSKNQYFLTWKLRAEMYSANADSWKEIQLPKALPGGRTSQFWDFHAINGVLYLQYFGGILSFDLHNEVFERCPYTKSLPYSKSKSNLLDFEGSAAMVFSESVTDKSVLGLWTLEDVCGKMSWSKKFNLELDCGIDRVHCYLGGGLFVVLNCRYGFLFYDYKKKEIQKLDHHPAKKGCASLLKYLKSVLQSTNYSKYNYTKYNESLVSL